MSSYDDTTVQEPETPREQRGRPGQPGQPGQPGPQRPRAHPVDVGHLVMGVAFVGLTIVWAVIQFDAIELEEARWLLPLPWLAAGAAGLLAVVLRRRDPQPDQPDWRQDWKQDHRDWKAQFKADQRAYKEKVKRDHQAMKEDLKRQVHGWKHGHDDQRGPGGHGGHGPH